MLTRGIPPAFRDGVHLLIPSIAIRSVLSLSGHAVTYRWRSLPRVHWHRANSGSSSSGCCVFRYHHGSFFVRSSFSIPTIIVTVDMCNTEIIRGDYGPLIVLSTREIYDFESFGRVVPRRAPILMPPLLYNDQHFEAFSPQITVGPQLPIRTTDSWCTTKTRL